MPNGKPGDRPDTDVLIHDIDVYTEEVNELIREVASLGGDEAISDLEMYTRYGWNPSDEKLRELRERLEQKREKLLDEKNG